MVIPADRWMTQRAQSDSVKEDQTLDSRFKSTAEASMAGRGRRTPSSNLMVRNAWRRPHEGEISQAIGDDLKDGALVDGPDGIKQVQLTSLSSSPRDGRKLTLGRSSSSRASALPRRSVDLSWDRHDHGKLHRGDAEGRSAATPAPGVRRVAPVFLRHWGAARAAPLTTRHKHRDGCGRMRVSRHADGRQKVAAKAR